MESPCLPLPAYLPVLQGPAGLSLGLACVLGIFVTQGLKRVQRLDKFEKDMRN